MEGLTNKYIITKTNGDEIESDAQYFVLRLDKDPHAVKAIQAYAESVKYENQQLYDDIIAKYPKNDKFIVTNNTQFWFSLWARVKLLFGRKLISKIEITVDAEVNVLGTELTQVYVEPFFKPKAKVLSQMAESPTPQ